MDLYELVRGPLAWVALIAFLLGSFYRIGSVVMGAGTAGGAQPPAPAGQRLASLLLWLVPFGTGPMRKNPLLTLVSFLFHICVIGTPLLLLAHNILWYQSWQLEWWSLPERLADVLTLVILAACCFFFLRRLLTPEVREVTRPQDFLLLALIAMPFLFGFLAYHQWGPYEPMLILHILTGEILLIVIPFTRLSHMVLFAFGRAQIEAEFAHGSRSHAW